MRGLWLENQKLTLRDDLPIPSPRDGECLVKVKKVGICNTDLELVRGYYPYRGILGHEFVGVCEQGPKDLQGQLVAGEINAACGHCEFCKKSIPTHCTNRSVLGIVNHHGAFADYLCLPSKNLHRIPSNVSIEAATFIEPLAAALEIQEQVNILPNSKVVVIGPGKLGRLIAMTMKLLPCDLTVVARTSQTAESLKDQGFQACTNGELEEHSYDLAIECTGNPSGFDDALKSLKPRGTLVLKSTYADKLTLDMASIVVNEINIVGSRCGPFDKAIKLLAEEKVDPTSLIHSSISFEHIIDGFEAAAQPGHLKVLVDI